MNVIIIKKTQSNKKTQTNIVTTDYELINISKKIQMITGFVMNLISDLFTVVISTVVCFPGFKQVNEPLGSFLLRLETRMFTRLLSSNHKNQSQLTLHRLFVCQKYLILNNFAS